jgi:serine/threonine protein phosphatase 1
MYQRINGSDWRNIWLVGDLHGCFAVLMSPPADKIRPLPGSSHLGGRSDRSRAAKREMSRASRCRWFRAVRGNHEQMALEALESGV